MSKQSYHLAQLNIARLLHPLDAQETAGFVAGLEPINALAETAPGFVWRLKDEEGDATSFRPMDDDMLIVNMSVWEDIDRLRDFAFKTVHAEYIKKRFQWFERMREAYMVLWWVQAGHIPDVSEAVARLEFLRKHGETAKAFTFRRIFSPPDGAI